MADYYNLLGVAPTASAEEIRAAFRRAAKRSHPDAHATGTPRQQEDAQRRFIQLAQAYETLSHVGLRRAYDERLRAAAPPPRGAGTSAAGAKPSAAKPQASTASQAPPGSKAPPKSERQQRADQARRPSPAGERQERADRARRSTERGAEQRQRGAEQERRERERAQHEAREAAARQRRTHAQAEAARARTYGRPPPERSVDDLVQDIESLLDRFGLDLRTPVEVIWDTLLKWARRIFRDTEPPQVPPRKPRVEPHRQTGPAPKSPPRPRRPSFRDQAEDAVFRELHEEPTVDRRAEDLELERDLARLKREMRDPAGKPGNAGETKTGSTRTAEDEELAALKKKLGKE